MDLEGHSGIVVVLTALNVEYEAVRRHLSGVRPHVHEAGTRFEVGSLPGGGRVAIVVTGKGNQPAAVLAERAISAFRPVALLFVGIAGALYDSIELGDIVVATKVYAYHGGTEDGGGFRASPVVWPAPHALEQLAGSIARDASWCRCAAPDDQRRPPEVHFAPIAAGEVVLNSRVTPLARQLHRHYGDAAAIEMESAGAAQAGHLNRSLPVLAIRGISDKADGAKYASDERGWQPAAAARAAAFAIALATELTAQPVESTVGSADPHAGTAVARPGVRRWVLIASIAAPPLSAGALHLIVRASYASFYSALGFGAGRLPVDGATLVLSTGYLGLVSAMVLAVLFGGVLTGAAMVPPTSGTRAAIPATALFMVLGLAVPMGVPLLPIPFIDAAALLFPIVMFGAAIRLTVRQPYWHAFAGLMLGLAVSAAVIGLARAAVESWPGSWWRPAAILFSVAGAAMVALGRWVAYERRRGGPAPAGDTTPGALLSRMNPLALIVAVTRERMTDRDAHRTIAGLGLAAVVMPVAVVVMLIYLVSLAADAGTAAREYGYVPADFAAPGIWSAPVVPATITPHRPGDDPARVCGASPGRAASLVARDDAGSWVLLRPIGPGAAQANVVHLPATHYTVQPVLAPDLREGQRWADPAC